MRPTATEAATKSRTAPAATSLARPIIGSNPGDTLSAMHSRAVLKPSAMKTHPMQRTTTHHSKADMEKRSPAKTTSTAAQRCTCALGSRLKRETIPFHAKPNERRRPRIKPVLLSVVIIERQLVNVEQRTFAAGEKVSVFRRRNRNLHICRHARGGAVFQRNHKFLIGIHRARIYEFTVCYYRRQSGVEKLPVLRFGTYFIRSRPVGKSHIYVARIRTAYEIPMVCI